jgi:hypothetical protein
VVPTLSPLFLPEDCSRASFRNVDFKEKHWTMDKILKQDPSKCITASSEPFRIDLGYSGLSLFVACICEQHSNRLESVLLEGACFAFTDATHCLITEEVEHNPQVLYLTEIMRNPT